MKSECFKAGALGLREAFGRKEMAFRLVRNWKVMAAASIWVNMMVKEETEGKRCAKEHPVQDFDLRRDLPNERGG
jgi:hypothetical protein